MTDYTKSTHAIDARGNKVRVEFVKFGKEGLLRFKILAPHRTTNSSWQTGTNWWFYKDGTMDCGLTLCPPEEPPVWALKGACEQIGASYDIYKKGGFSVLALNAIRAHAILIAETKEEPVDPDLVKAREYAAQVWDGRECPTQAEATRKGGFDDTPEVQAALLAIKGDRT